MWAVITGEAEEDGTSQYVKLQHRNFYLERYREYLETK